MAGTQSGGDSPAREQLSALRSLLVLAMLLTQQDSQATILNMVANAVESLGRCQLKGIYFDGRWQGVPVPGPGAAAVSPPPAELVTAGLPPGGGQVELAGLPWGWAYPLASLHGPAGYLIVGAAWLPAESERFRLQVLAQQAAVALANAHLHHREREQAEELQARDWERFSDPRRTTYRAYTVLQDGREDVVDGLLREVDDTGYDRDLDQEWVRFLDRWYSPLRFPVHGLQMLAAYVAQMAPASRVTNCAAFQSADELRRVQRIAYRTVQLSGPPPGLGTARRHQATWEDAEAFQPLRELIERALVAYDWGEAFTVTNLVIKPRIDRLVNQEIAGTLATANGDPILASIHFSLDEDARWHRAWTTALLRHLIEDTPANAEVVSGWIGKWSPLAARALEAFAGTLAEAPVPLDANAVTARITSDVSRDTDSMLNAPPASTAP